MKKTMKLLILIFLNGVIYLLTNNIYAQSYTLQFSATGASSNIDSVIVENLIQNQSVKLNSGDVLQLQLGPDNIIQNDLNEIEAHIYFDDINQTTKFKFSISDASVCHITIYDITGRLLTLFKNTLQMGTHVFSIDGLKAGFYIVNIKTDQGRKSLKFCSKPSINFSLPALTYDNFDPSVINKKIIVKNDPFKSIVTMAYNAGDLLLIKTYSGIYKTVSTLIPSQSQTVSILFSECTDASQNHYASVIIGTQIWMAENLKSNQYCNGSDILNEQNMNNWSLLLTGAWVYLNNDIAMDDKYGKLYNFYAASDIRNPCPCGWHVPEKSEWETLIAFLGGEEVAGGKLKQTGTQFWQSPNMANNETGFTALPGRSRSNLGYFGTDSGDDAFFLTKTINGSYCWVFGIGNGGTGIFANETSKKFGASIRCIKDVEGF